jgi:hypothetical protein
MSFCREKRRNLKDLKVLLTYLALYWNNLHGDVLKLSSFELYGRIVGYLATLLSCHPNAALCWKGCAVSLFTRFDLEDFHCPRQWLSVLKPQQNHSSVLFYIQSHIRLIHTGSLAILPCVPLNPLHRVILNRIK